MLCLPTRFAAVILSFAPLFFQRSWRHAEVLLIGAVLAPGKRTVTPLEADVAQVDFFGSALRRQHLKAEPLVIEAAPLPPEGQPAGVDAASQEAFAAALGRFRTAGGTILLVAHELGPLQPLIDRAVVVHDGRIAHEGPPPEPAGHHAEPGHDHVHPHADQVQAGICEWAPTDRMAAG